MSKSEIGAILSRLNDLDHRFDEIDARFDGVGVRIDELEKRMITKADVFQSVLTVQAFFAATIVGTVVVLNSIGTFG